MAITNGYATLTEFKLYANITSSNANDDTVIENIIEGASRQIDARTGRFFYQLSDTQYFVADDPECLRVEDIALNSGVSVYSDIDGDGVYEWTWDSNDYYLYPYNSQPNFPYTKIERKRTASTFFSLAPKGNKVTATYGFPAIPDDVRQACLIIAKSDYQERFGENTSAIATVTGAGVVLSPQGFPKSAAEKLAGYKKRT